MFDDLVKIFDYPDFSIKIVDSIKEIKEIFDNAMSDLIKALINDVKLIFLIQVLKEQHCQVY